MKFSVFLTMSLCTILLAGCGEKSEPAEPEQKASTASTASASGQSNADASQADAAQQTATAATDLSAHPGKALHDANCISCHDSAVYTREDRKIGDFPKLLAQVRRCDANLGSRLFDEDIEQVADYLNQAYYKFEQ